MRHLLVSVVRDGRCDGQWPLKAKGRAWFARKRGVNAGYTNDGVRARTTCPFLGRDNVDEVGSASEQDTSDPTSRAYPTRRQSRKYYSWGTSWTESGGRTAAVRPRPMPVTSET